MNDIVALVVMLGALSEFSIGQEKVVQDSLAGVTGDTLQRQQAGEEDEWYWYQFRSTVPQVIGNDKASIEEDRVFDVSVQPLIIGERESVSVALGNFQKPESEFNTAAKALSGKLMIGYGSYSSPSIDGWVGAASKKSDILFRGGLTSTKGRSVNQDYNSGFAGLMGGVFFSERAGIFSGGRLQADIDFTQNQYRLYGSSTPARMRTVRGLLNILRSRVNYADGGFFNASLSLSSLLMKDSVRNNEQYLGVEVSGGTTISRTRLKSELKAWRSFSSTRSSQHDPHYASMNGSIEYEVGENVSLTAGGILYLERGSDSQSRIRALPRGGVEWKPVAALNIYGRYEPSIEKSSLSDFLQTNPYLWYSVSIRNIEFRNNISLGIKAEIAKDVAAGCSATYSKAGNYPVFLATPDNLWRVEYAGTRILAFQAEMHAEVAGKHTVGFVFNGGNAKARLPGGTPGADERQVPYYPDVTASLTYHHRFSEKFTVGSNVQYIGQRYADERNSRRLSSFTLWDIDAEMEVTKRLIIAVSIHNILDQQQYWWEHYAGESRRVRLSVGFTW